jgi:O-antigen/teichoic acid export membrane protein
MDGSSGRGATAIRGGSIRVVGYAAGVLVSLGAAAILVHHLGVSTFGRYVTVTSLIGLVGGVTEAGIYVYGIREFGHRADPDRRALIANLLAMRLLLTIVGIFLAVCFGLAVGYQGVLILGTLIAGAGLLIQVSSDVLSIPLQAQLRLARLTAVDLVRRIIALALIAAFALLGAGLLPFFVASVLAGAAALFLLATMVRPALTLRLSFDFHAWRNLFVETLPFAIAVSIGAIYFYVTVIIMSLIASARQTGLFGTSFRVIQVLLTVPTLLLTAIFPLMARGYSDEDSRIADIAGKVLRVALIVGVWMSLAVALAAPFIIDVIAGPRGRGAASVLEIQSIVLTLSFVSTSAALALASVRRYTPLIIASSSALALNIVLALALVPALGARGGALADVLTELAAAVGLTVVLTRVLPGHEIRASLAAPVLIAAALSASVLLVPVAPVVRAVGATLIYFGVLLVTHAIPEDVIAAVRRL